MLRMAHPIEVVHLKLFIRFWSIPCVLQDPLIPFSGFPSHNLLIPAVTFTSFCSGTSSRPNFKPTPIYVHVLTISICYSYRESYSGHYCHSMLSPSCPAVSWWLTNPICPNRVHVCLRQKSFCSRFKRCDSRKPFLASC